MLQRKLARQQDRVPSDGAAKRQTLHLHTPVEDSMQLATGVGNSSGRFMLYEPHRLYRGKVLQTALARARQLTVTDDLPRTRGGRSSRRP